MMRRIEGLKVSLMMVLLSIGGAWAQISPGKLSQFHHELEGIRNCTACHELGEAPTNEKCLICHVAIRSRIDAREGYHGSEDVFDESCMLCHSEHHGREYALVYWPEDMNGFNHTLTGFDLAGSHGKLDCRECHQPRFQSWPDSSLLSSVNRDRTFMGLNHDCRLCHHDEHGEQLTDDCLRCHSFDQWVPAAGFNHASARFPLEGAHSRVACEKCHGMEPVSDLPAPSRLIQKRERQGLQTRYQGLEFGHCSVCHKDVHQGRLGGDCASCHTVDSFRSVTAAAFDHSTTGFELKGRHATVSCRGCHIDGDAIRPVRHETCSDCHRDTHRGQFADRRDGGACDRCHSEGGFLPPRFGVEAHRETRFALTGSHRAVPCIACHTRIPANDGETYARFDFPDMRCQTCHEDAHRGQLDHWISQSGCEFCHDTEDWHTTTFDHRLARFPLEGKHREILCLRCHTIKNDGMDRVIWMKPLTMDCSGCHEDPHVGQFLSPEARDGGTPCDRCHSPHGWNALRFMHNRDARFALDGAHDQLPCTACHKPTLAADGTLVTLYRPLGMACSDCHEPEVVVPDTDQAETK